MPTTTHKVPADPRGSTMQTKAAPCQGSGNREIATDTHNRKGHPVGRVTCPACGQEFVARTRSLKHYGDHGLTHLTYSATVPQHKPA